MITAVPSPAASVDFPRQREVGIQRAQPAGIHVQVGEIAYVWPSIHLHGERLANNAVLSHDLPPAPTFTPSGGEQVDRKRAVVEWHAPGAEKVEIIIENDELQHVPDLTLSNKGLRLRIPPQFLTPGQEYKIEVLSIAENGNRTITESTFEAAE